MRRIGILGGTFDPPHIGHLLLAETAREALHLDQVLFVPVGVQPLKLDIRSDVDHRLEMVKLAIADNPYFAISYVDIEREGPHYTADTLPLIQSDYPDAQLYFLMGGDSLRDFPKWTRPEAIIDVAKLAVMRRSDEDITADMHDDIISNLSKQIEMVDTPLLSIWMSSSHIVERIQQKKSIRYLVQDTVLNYIHAHNLYTVESP
ncbi:MAG: nicotinate-nucleotide adenylyltransferase [Chloroflexota bacterium]